MATTTSPIQLEANRANAQLSTGPRTLAGKLASSANARSHGLTARQALLPTEDPSAYDLHHQTFENHYLTHDPILGAAVTELADLQWRLRRVPIFEAQLIAVEFTRLKTEPELAPLIKNLRNDDQIVTLAFSRLILSKVLPNLFNQEARLARRAEKLERKLETTRLPSPMPPPIPAREQKEVAVQKLAEHPMESSPPPPLPQKQNQKIEPIRVTAQPGRNQSCPCHSGLKFKRCCLNRPQTPGTPTPSQAS